MEPRDFAYWLQGFFEIQEPESINEKQLKMIKAHLKMVQHYDTVEKQSQPTDKKKKIHPSGLDVLC